MYRDVHVCPRLTLKSVEPVPMHGRLTASFAFIGMQSVSINVSDLPGVELTGSTHMSLSGFSPTIFRQPGIESGPRGLDFTFSL